MSNQLNVEVITDILNKMKDCSSLDEIKGLAAALDSYITVILEKDMPVIIKFEATENGAIPLIKAIRTATNMGLAESKAMYDKGVFNTSEFGNTTSVSREIAVKFIREIKHVAKSYEIISAPKGFKVLYGKA